MKAIIPVAGFGTRLRPHTLTKPKVLMSVAGKPMIHHIIEQLISEKLVESIVLVTGFMGNKIENYLNQNFDFKFENAIQEEAKGLGHAIHCSKHLFNKNKPEDVIIILGDTLFDVDLSKMCRNDFSVIGVKKVEDPRRFGVVEKDSNGFITKFIEKPANSEVSKSNEAIVGLYYLKNSNTLFESLQSIIDNDIKTKNEFQLTDALSGMLANKEKIVTYQVDGWLDCGKPETILETNQYLLKKYSDASNNKSQHQYSYIGSNCDIKNSIIGEYTSVGSNCKIINSIITNSIIEPNSHIENAIIKDSLIGENVTVKYKEKILNLGDFSEC